MANRRLAPPEQQPNEFFFTAENRTWADKVIARYPAGRQASAVIPLLWRAQEQHDGWVSEAAIRAVADLLGMPYIRALEIATFAPDAIPWSGLAFRTTTWALRDWLDLRHPAAGWPDLATGS